MSLPSARSTATGSHEARTACGNRRCPALLEELLANHDGSLQFIDGLEDLQAHILVKCQRSQILVNFSLSRRRLLPVDKRIQPSHQKEDLSITLDSRKNFQCGPQIRLSERRLVPVVELTQTLGDPIFGTGCVMQVIVEIPLFAFRLWPCRLGSVSILRECA